MNILKNNGQIENETNNTYCVYMHTTPSGKKYVGISKNDVMKRWDCGRGYKGNTHFFNAIMKYARRIIMEHLVGSLIDLFEGLNKYSLKINSN